VIDTQSAPIQVGELNRLVRLSLESEFPLLWVAGEVSNCVRAASGHVYFSLKDETAQVRCVMYRSRAQSLPWKVENGLRVEARALVTLYEQRGEFQLTVETLRRSGLGALFEAFARLKEKLRGEGLFDIARKRPLPRFPRAIGIVSSPRAAALADVITALRRRAPHIPLILYPSTVQGDSAAAELRSAIETAGRHGRCDVLLLVRGGGSAEDLWAFNDEDLARSIASSPIPVATGIGHDTDISIADFVADLHAPTPTAAAELVSQGWKEGSGEITALGVKLTRAVEMRLSIAAQALDRQQLRLVHPRQRLADVRQRMGFAAAMLGRSAKQRLIGQSQRLARLADLLRAHAPQPAQLRRQLGLHERSLRAAASHLGQSRRQRLEALGSGLRLLDPHSTLARGYAIVRDAGGKPVVDAGKLQLDQYLTLEFATGQAGVRVTAAAAESPPLQTR
jgi:exodeoxyribonuclease VII large subunit